MDKFDNNMRGSYEERRIYSGENSFKNQRASYSNSKNYDYKCTCNDLRVNVEDGKIYTEEIILKKQEGAVIYGVVLFEDRTPVEGATVILNTINKNNGKVTPISFMFTDENGVFIFGIQNTKNDYLLNVVYNESI